MYSVSVIKYGEVMSLELPWFRVIVTASPFNLRLRSANQ